MKKHLAPTFLILLIAVSATVLAQTYWPVDTEKNPIRYETNLGQGFVVGTNNAACEGSIAIGANDITEKAIVLDATDAVQLGTGTNTTPNSVQHMEHSLAPIFVDTEVSNTVTTVHSAPHAGCILIGKTTAVDKVWISAGSGTNLWVLVN